MMINTRLLFIALLGSFILSASAIEAVGVSVAPTRLDVSGNIFSSVSREILVSNIAAEPAAYQLSVDSWQTAVAISPAEFILEPNARQLVTVKIKPRWPLAINTSISVVARPLSQGNLTAAGGIKVPLSMSVFPQWWQLSLAVLAVCLIGFFGVKLGKAFKDRKKSDE